LSEPPKDLACELLRQSLAAWRLKGHVRRTTTGPILIEEAGNEISIEPAPPELPFRWMVSVDGRKRGAVSLVAVLRQVRTALDPGYATNRVRIAVSPLVPQ
jgi:hypothetical protein